MDLQAIRETAKVGLFLDLSTTIKDEREPFVVLLKLVKDDANLQDAYKIYKHFFFSFIIFVHDEFEVDLLMALEDIDVTQVLAESKVVINIASGTLDNWVASIKENSCEETEDEIRKVFNEIQDYFEMKGLSFIFKGLTKKAQRIGYTLDYHPKP